MDYEKKYKEALERAKGMWEQGMMPERIEYIFPELKESEDERIRKEIIFFFEQEIPQCSIEEHKEYMRKWISWLEKQGEKANIHQDTEDDLRRQSTIQVLEYARSLDAYNQYGKESINKDIAWLEKQGQEPKKVSIWKHWKNGIAGNGDGEQIYLIKYGNTYHLSSCLSFECDYIELSELDSLMLEKQGEQNKQHLYDIIIALWELLDKIDTFSDLQIDDTNPDNPFRKIEHITEERHKFVKSDGYNLYIEGEQITDFHQELMKFNATDEVEIETCDKVEPKFKVGDWIVYDGLGTYKIIEIHEGWYSVIDNNDKRWSVMFDKENLCHLWTIQDAKDGDVLCGYPESEYPWIGIFHKLNAEGSFVSHCYLQAGQHGEFCPPSGENIFGKRNVDNHSLNVVPATKEQRDLLFQKMKEAGYEWNAEKKELKDIENKHAWSEEDERNLRGIICEIEINKFNAPEYDMETYDGFLSWLKSLKDRV